MSIRGRRSHSHVRRLMTPHVGARAPVDVETAETPLADADQLIATFRVRAYSEARQRQRRAAAPEAAAHWGQVANLITRRTSEEHDDELSTGTERDAHAARRGRELGVRPAVRFFEVDPLDELERILAVRRQCFRLAVLWRRRRSRPSRSHRNRNSSRGLLRRDPRRRRGKLAAPGGRPPPVRSRGAGNLRAPQGRSALARTFPGSRGDSRAMPRTTAFAGGSREPPRPASPRRFVTKSGSVFPSPLGA